MGYIYINLNISPIYYVISIFIFAFILLFTKKITSSLLGGYCFLIIAATVLRRYSTNMAQLEIIPFMTYKSALLNEDIRWQIVCNVGMSVPIGFLVPATLKNISMAGKKLLITLLIGAAFSVSIEVLQFVLHRGYSETDDVISSVIGSLIGFAVYILMIRFIRMWSRKK